MCTLCYDPDRKQKLNDLISLQACHLHLPSHISIQSNVLPYGAIVTGDRELANSGDFVEVVNDLKVNKTFNEHM